MKTFLKKLRSIYIINLLLRNLILCVKPLSKSFYKKLADHLPLQGIISIKLLNGKNIKMFSNSDDFMLKEAFFGISDEHGTDTLVSILAPKSKVIFDIGANTGLFSVFCFGYNTDAKIYAFEPVHSIANRFDRNIDLNKPNNIELHQNVISGSSSGFVSLFVPKTEISYSSSSLKEFHDAGSVEEIKVKALTLDDFFIENEIIRADLIKIDVEWHEYEVLTGAMNVLSKCSPLLIVEILFAETEEKKNASLLGKLPADHHLKIGKFLKELGYYFYEIYHDGILRVDELEPGNHERNYLFSKKKSINKKLSFSAKEEIINQLLN